MRTVRMYKTSFSAAHFIPGHPKCGKLHGHNYHLKVMVTSELHWIDFAWIKKATERVLEKYDHTTLELHTAEELGVAIQYELTEILIDIVQRETHTDTEDIEISLEIWETDNFGVTIP